MPGILARYLLWEIIKVFIVSVVSLTVLLMLFGVLRQLLREGLGLSAIFQLIPYVLPMGLQYALPTTLLFAICCVYGRASADGEISAIKAAGVSPTKVIMPALWLSLMISPFAVWLGDLAVSWGRPGITRVALHSLEEIVYRVLRSQHSYSSPNGFSIHVQGIEGRKMVWPTIQLAGRNGQPLTLRAREGSLELDPEREMLIVRLVDTHAQQNGQWQMIWGGELPPAEIPLRKAAQKGGSGGTPSELPLWQIRPDAQRQRQNITASKFQLASLSGMALATGRLDDLGSNLSKHHLATIEVSTHRLLRLEAEPWRRWSGGFACFFFALVGTPLAIRMRSADYMSTFGMCFVPILLVYYPAFLVSCEQAKHGSVPPYSPWAANGLLAIIGVLLIRKICRQ
jgi:lipopolysaccharide export system permease protein